MWAGVENGPCGRSSGTREHTVGFRASGFLLLSVAPEVMTDDVVVTTMVLDKEVQAFIAPVETPLPDNILGLDPAVWKSIHETLGEERSGAIEDLTADEQSETEDGGAA